MNMSKMAKIIVTIGAIIIYIIVATVIVASIKESGGSSSFISLILLVALIGAIRAIWKKPKDDDANRDNSVLQK